MTRSDKPKTEGWMGEKPEHARRYHYIVDTRSLCGRYGLYFGALAEHRPGQAREREDCAECFKRATARHPRQT